MYMLAYARFNAIPQPLLMFLASIREILSFSAIKTSQMALVGFAKTQFG
jgi:hypothetical protein